MRARFFISGFSGIEDLYVRGFLFWVIGPLD